MTTAYTPRTKDMRRPVGQGWRESARERRVGAMLHYDASSSDTGSVAWLTDPRAANFGYHWIVTDDGTAIQLAPYTARVFHAGKCRPSATFSERAPYRDANSAFVGISIAATAGDRVTPVQLLTVAWLCRFVFDKEGWPITDSWRITGHSNEAWPRGRKSDPVGPDPRHPVMSVTDVRHLVMMTP